MQANNQEPVRITPAEWEVMRAIWNVRSSIPASEIIQALEPNSSWKPKTVRTFLNRLVSKNALRTVVKKTPDGQELLHYEALIDEPTTLRVERETFLDRFFGGTIRSMLSCCIEMGEISTEELEAMRDMIDRQVAMQREQSSSGTEPIGESKHDT